MHISCGRYKTGMLKVENLLKLYDALQKRTTNCERFFTPLHRLINRRSACRRRSKCPCVNRLIGNVHAQDTSEFWREV